MHITIGHGKNKKINKTLYVEAVCAPVEHVAVVRPLLNVYRNRHIGGDALPNAVVVNIVEHSNTVW